VRRSENPSQTATCDKILDLLFLRNTNMPTAKPKWGFVSGYWVPQIQLDETIRLGLPAEIAKTASDLLSVLTYKNARTEQELRWLRAESGVDRSVQPAAGPSLRRNED
jgi:hypothetical protein